MSTPTNVTYKSQKMAARLVESIGFRTGLTCTAGTDSTSTPSGGVAGVGQPTILVGAASAGSAGCFIRITSLQKPYAADALGNSGFNYGPHTVQVCFEQNYASTVPTADVTPIYQIAQIIEECTKTGAALEIFECANGTAPAAAQMTSANLKTRMNVDQSWGNQASQ